MEKVRAKLRLDQITQRTSAYHTAKTLEFNAVGDNNPENSQFSKSTPSGTINIVVENEAAAAFFQPGKEYYLDFTEA